MAKLIARQSSPDTGSDTEVTFKTARACTNERAIEYIELEDTPSKPTAIDPRKKFQTAVLAKIKSQHVEPSLISKATNIPESRLRSIIGSKPGVALFSDLVALAAFFEISVDSFFS